MVKIELELPIYIVVKVNCSPNQDSVWQANIDIVVPFLDKRKAEERLQELKDFTDSTHNLRIIESSVSALILAPPVRPMTLEEATKIINKHNTEPLDKEAERREERPAREYDRNETLRRLVE